MKFGETGDQSSCQAVCSGDLVNSRETLLQYGGSLSSLSGADGWYVWHTRLCYRRDPQESGPPCLSLSQLHKTTASSWTSINVRLNSTKPLTHTHTHIHEPSLSHQTMRCKVLGTSQSPRRFIVDFFHAGLLPESWEVWDVCVFYRWE